MHPPSRFWADWTSPQFDAARTATDDFAVMGVTWAGDPEEPTAGTVVEVRVRNRCGRKLEALEVLFRAEGIRGGDTIYSGQGNLLEAIYPDSVRTVMIALPGASTFYDSVTVVPVRPPVR